VKAYSFRLAAVARVRQLEDGVAAQQLATASAGVTRAKHGLDRATELLEQLEVPEGSLAVQEVHWAQDQADRMAESRRAHLTALEAAEAERTVARERWLATRRRCAVLERLDDRRRGEWQTEFDRAEGKELDDVASVRALARRAGTSGGWS